MGINNSMDNLVIDFKAEEVYIPSDEAIMGKVVVTKGIDNVKLFHRAYNMGKEHKQNEVRKVLGLYG